MITSLGKVLSLLSNPFTIIGLVLLIILICLLFYIKKRYPKIEIIINQIGKSIFERLEIITTDDVLVETIFYNKKLIGYDSDDKNIIKLISFHSQFTNESSIKSFYIGREINLDDVLTKSEVNVLKNKNFREKYNFVIKKYKV